jgi:hypothetical protein
MLSLHATFRSYFNDVQGHIQNGTPQQFVNAEARARPRAHILKRDGFEAKCKPKALGDVTPKSEGGA